MEKRQRGQHSARGKLFKIGLLKEQDCFGLEAAVGHQAGDKKNRGVGKGRFERHIGGANY